MHTNLSTFSLSTSTTHDSHGTQAFVGDDEIRSEQARCVGHPPAHRRQRLDIVQPAGADGQPRQHQLGPISTIGITTCHKFSIIQSLNLRQTEMYVVTQLTGTAHAVDF